jgi:hypothetical protein
VQVRVGASEGYWVLKINVDDGWNLWFQDILGTRPKWPDVIMKILGTTCKKSLGQAEKRDASLHDCTLFLRSYMLVQMQLLLYLWFCSYVLRSFVVGYPSEYADK